jgi:hypothetical protein
MSESRLPEIPLFEDPQAAPAIAADPAIARFVAEMRELGGATLDLGDQARALCDRAIADTEPYFTGRGAKRVQDAWRTSKAVRDLALLPRLHEALFAAYGRRSFPFQTLNFREGSQQELHADTIHFSSLPERFMCGVWIALEDIEPGSGALTWRPGSHRMPVMTMRDAGVNSALPQAEDYGRHFVPRFAERIEGSGIAAEELLIPKGTAFVWAANLAHGGSPITRAGATRRSLVVHCYFDEGLYFTPLVSDVEGGRLALRLPPDIRTGGWRWPRRDGRRAKVRLKTLLAAAWREVSNRPHLF